MKVQVIGNCQVRPVSTFLGLLCPDVEILEPVVVHLEKDDNRKSNYERCDQADVVYTQHIHDTNPVNHLQTGVLKNRYGDKITTWPNCFFSGQTPDVVSIASKNTKNVIGPLDTYHLRSILASWKSSQSAESCVESLLSREGVLLSDPVRDSLFSLSELKKREHDLDIHVADYIEENWRKTRLFHVFNHPTNNLLIELVVRMAKYGKLPIRNQLGEMYWPESLNRVIPPVFLSSKLKLDLEYEANTSSKGFDIVVLGESSLKLGEATILPIEDLVDKFYTSYDTQLSKCDDLKFTPGYLSINSFL